MKYFIAALFIFTYTFSDAQEIIKGENQIRNGNFEEDNRYFSSDLTYMESEVFPGHYSVTDSASTLNSAFIELAEHTSGNDLYLAADPAGNENEKIWCTEVTVEPSTEYVFSIWLAILHRANENASEIIFKINDEQIGDPASLEEQEWTQYSWKWKSGSNAGTVSICLVNDVLTSSGNDLAIDDAEFYSLKPKPAIVRPFVGDTLPVKAHFPFDETKLTGYSTLKLKSLVEILNKYPAMNIKILAHADGYGKDAYNDALSEKRAKEVFDFLVSESISPDRLQIEFFGERKLIYEGNKFREHVKNRRVEFVVSGYNP